MSRFKGYYYRLLLQSGVYKKKAIPGYDFTILTEKWARRESICVGDHFIRGNKPAIDVSFCVPMYNVEDCIETLLSEIACQSTKYFYEVILVDDGSIDETAKRVKEFIADKPNFTYIYQENSGIGAARNTAINHASGNYITFVDSDDEICDGYIDILMDKAIQENADIVKGKYCLKRSGHLHQRGIAFGYIWGGVYRASLFDRIRFPVGYWYEDMINLFLVQPMADRSCTLDHNVIYHNDVVDSASKRQSKAISYQAIEDLYLVQSLANDYWKLGLKDKLYFEQRLLAECSHLMVNRTSLMDESVRVQIFLACNELFEKYGITSKHFTGVDRIFTEAILSKDFRA